jgi:epsilon-lactone hydrolase
MLRLLLFAPVFLWLSVRTLVRRVLRGPLRPGWSFPFELMVAVMSSQPRTRGPEQIPARRADLKALSTLAPPPGGVRFEAIQAGGVPAQWGVPQQGDSGAVVLYFHGGGYALGSVEGYRGFTAQLALDSGSRVLAVEYRLAPEHPYPAALEDARAAYRWLLGTGVDPKRLVVAGDSAGGGLSLSLLVALVEAGEPLPAGAVLLSPWVDLACETPAFTELVAYDFLEREELRAWGRMYAGALELKDPRVSPLRARLQGLPPLFIQGGGVELFKDDIVLLAERARAAGVAVELDMCEHLPHVPAVMGALSPQGREAAVRVGQALRRMVDSAASGERAVGGVTAARG